MAHFSPSSPSLADALWLRAPHLQHLLALLNSDGARTRLVGGCVRNALLGLPVTDIDLATTLPPEAIMARLTHAAIRNVPTGLEHGTVTAVCEGHHIEITTLRVDVRTDGRRAEVAFTDDWEADAARRDFTINALYADADGRVFDPLRGLPDLAARRVRFIGSPDARIREDALRILRFFRFAACLQPDTEPLDSAARDACRIRAAMTETLSGERIQKEMLRLLSAPAPLRALLAMADCGVLARIGLPAAISAPTQTLLARMTAIESAPTPLRRLFVLAGGDSARLARLSKRWKLPRRDRDHLATLATVMMERPDLAAPVARWMLLDAVSLPLFTDALTLFFAQRDDTSAAAQQQLTAQLAQAASDKERLFPVSGSDLLACGILPGPQMGECLRQGRILWARSGFTLQKFDILDKIIY